MRLAWVATFAVVLLTGCATTTQNSLTEDQRRSLRIVSTSVDFAPGAFLQWTDAATQYARSTDPNALSVLGANPTETGPRRDFVERLASQKLKAAFDRILPPAFQGNLPARVAVHVHRFDLPSGLIRFFGTTYNEITADVTVVDATSGAPLLDAPDFEGRVETGGILRLAMEQAMPDPADRMANQFADSYCNWLKSGTQLAIGAQFQSLTMCH